MIALSTLPDRDAAQFLKIASQGAGIATHEELWRWLQGDVQAWLAHEVMLVGWGDFRNADVQFDIVSSMPGMRSHHWSPSTLAPLISHFRDCWTAAQQVPCPLDMRTCIGLLRLSGVDSAAVDALSRMRFATVHGVAGLRPGSERIFAALSGENMPQPGSGQALKLLVPFIECALRRMPPAPVKQSPGRSHVERGSSRFTSLSERERQIMEWVAMGKTNPEIGCILSISEFTVKNHMKSIFGKLDVTNRAQAVAKLTRIESYA
jgi:transcriptional regulator EpsA